MKTTEDLTPKQDSTHLKRNSIPKATLGKARPIGSLRPMKSMVRIKSCRPNTLLENKTRKRTIKVL